MNHVCTDTVRCMSVVQPHLWSIGDGLRWMIHSIVCPFLIMQLKTFVLPWKWMSRTQGTLVIPVLCMVQCKVMTRACSLLCRKRYPCNVWIIVIHKCAQCSNDGNITDDIYILRVLLASMNFSDFQRLLQIYLQYLFLKVVLHWTF